MRVTTRPAALMMSLGLVACGGDDEDPAAPVDSITYELFDSTVELDESNLATLTDSRSDGVLVFSALPPVLANSQLGDVILAGSTPAIPTGLLRVVLAVEPQTDGTVWVRTASAPLQLAFRKLSARMSRTIDERGVVAPGQSALEQALTVSGGKWLERTEPIRVFDGDGKPATKDDQVYITGLLGGGFTFSVSIDVDWGEVLNLPNAVKDCLEDAAGSLLSASIPNCSIDALMPPLTASFNVEITAAGDIAIEGTTFQPYEHPILIEGIDLPELPLGPLVFKPSVDLAASVGGEAASRFHIGVSAQVSVPVSGSFSTSGAGSFPTPVPTVTISPTVTDATLSAKAWLRVGPRLHLRLYGLAGPYAGVDLTATLDADQERQPCFTLDGGLQAVVGFDVVVDLPVLGYVSLVDENTDVTLAEETVATGSCGQPPVTVAVPPGSTLTADTLLNPTFTPWSAAYSGTTDSAPYSVPAGMGFSDLVHTLDGHWLLTGSHASALTKVNHTGDVVWSRRFVGTDDWPGTLTDRLAVERAVTAGDATLWLSAYPYALLRLTQGGDLLSAMRFENVGHEDNSRFTSLEPDSAGGVVLAGNIDDQVTDPRGWLVRLDPLGEVEWSRTWAAPGFNVYPTTLLRHGQDWVVAGSAQDQVDLLSVHAFALRFDADGHMLWARRYDSCDGILQPTTSLTTFDGNIVVAGNVDIGPLRSFVMKVDTNGDVLFTNTFWSGNIIDWMSLRDLVELPTSGFIATGYYYFNPPQWDDIWVATLDVSGAPVWMQRMGEESAEQFVSTNDWEPSVTLTADGGALVSAYTESLAGGDPGLWIAKVQAKDGAITFDPTTGVTRSPIAAPTYACAIVGSSWPVTVTDQPGAPASIELIAEDAGVTRNALTP